ncbi:MAG: hypothetical protein RL398_1355, partial [Planctomycetota bacterium]
MPCERVLVRGPAFLETSLNKFTLASLLVLASTAAAQNCFEPNLGTNIGAGDDTVLSGGPIGFAFPFNGQTYTDIYVSTNGFLYLASPTTAIPTASNCCQGSTAILVGSANPMIAPFWDDLNVIAANGAGVYVNSSASACVVTWDNVVQFGNTVQFQLQVQLLPSGEIKFTYGGNTQLRVAGDVLVGVSEGNGALVPAASDFSVPGASTSFTTFEMFNAAGSFDMAGDSLSLIPTGPTWFYLATDCRGSTATYGNGCIRQVDSFYESFGSAAAFDLANSSAMMLNTGNGYLVLPSTTGFVAPTAAAQALALGDDSETTVSLSAAMPVAGGSTSNLTVCSNGYVSVASGNGTGYTPNVATFLTGTQTSWRCWHDYNPTIAGSGQVKFEEIAGIAYVTWDGVFDYGTTGPGSTFQFQFELATGNVTFVTGNFSLLGNAHLVGYSVGGASNDPGNTDLSVALP